MVAKITWGCGNDVIRSPTSGATVVPEPATLVLVAAGAVLCVTARRRRSAPAV
jgi:Holliday junction resolvase